MFITTVVYADKKSNEADSRKSILLRECYSNIYSHVKYSYIKRSLLKKGKRKYKKKIIQIVYVCSRMNIKLYSFP